MGDLISVVVPIYNTDAFLEECIQSIQNQTHKELEIILVNDGSTDTSGAICDRYAQEDDRIVVIHTENMGRVNARNTGLLASKGEYIGFIDSDDWIDAGMYQHMVEKMKEHDVSMVQVGVMREYPEKTEYIFNSDEGIYTNVSTDINCHYKTMFLPVNNIKNRAKVLPYLVNKLFEKAALKEFVLAIPKTIFWGEDATIIYSFLPSQKRIYVSSQCFYHYRRHLNSTVFSLDEKALQSINSMYEHLKKSLISHSDAELLLEGLKVYYKNLFAYSLKYIVHDDIWEEIAVDIVPIKQIKGNKKIALYGAGTFGKRYISKFDKISGGGVLIGVFDKKGEGTLLGYEIQLPTQLQKLDFDFLVIAVGSEDVATEIKSELINEYDVDMNKIIWEEPITLWI
ncbi:MAG: glycosyltransferase family 2 protein [Bacillota bacterium]